MSAAGRGCDQVVRARCLVIAVAAALCACSHNAKPTATAPETQVAFRLSAAAGQTPRWEMRKGESANIPAMILHEAPTYPREAIALRLPLVIVAAKVIVDPEGKVSEVRIAPGDTTSSRSLFDEAVRTGVSEWRYVPLTFTRWKDVLDAQGNVIESKPEAIERRPFSLDYEFRFELRDGKPFVGTTPQTKLR